jgi:hypothetical protein
VGGCLAHLFPRCHHVSPQKKEARLLAGLVGIKSMGKFVSSFGAGTGSRTALHARTRTTPMDV